MSSNNSDINCSRDMHDEDMNIDVTEKEWIFTNKIVNEQRDHTSDIKFNNNNINIHNSNNNNYNDTECNKINTGSNNNNNSSSVDNLINDNNVNILNNKLISYYNNNSNNSSNSNNNSNNNKDIKEGEKMRPIGENINSILRDLGNSATLDECTLDKNCNIHHGNKKECNSSINGSDNTNNSNNNNQNSNNTIYNKSIGNELNVLQQIAEKDNDHYDYRKTITPIISISGDLEKELSETFKSSISLKKDKVFIFKSRDFGEGEGQIPISLSAPASPVTSDDELVRGDIHDVLFDTSTPLIMKRGLEVNGREANLLFRSKETENPPQDSPTVMPDRIEVSDSSSSDESPLTPDAPGKMVVTEISAFESPVTCKLVQTQIERKPSFRKKLKFRRNSQQLPEINISELEEPCHNIIEEGKHLSEQANKSMKVISELLNKLFLKKKYSKIDLFMGLVLLNSYYKEIVIRNWDCMSNKEQLEEGLRYIRFSTAAYGRKLYYGLMSSGFIKFLKGVVGTDSTNLKIISKHTGVKKEDIITSKWFSSKYSPGHYLALDHEKKSLVFVLRGTFNYFDVITDLVAKSYLYMDGCAHLGILLCAHMKMKEMYVLIRKTLDIYKGYRLVVTGHSLGAGVASLFTILFHDMHPEIPIHCFAYGVPCILSLEVASHPKIKSLITTYCMNDDIIPRLSFNSLFYLREVIDSILLQSKTKIQKVFQIVSSGNNLGQKMTKRFSKILKVAPTIDLTNVSHSPSDEQSLFPPGNIFRLVKLSKGIYVAEATDQKSYDKIIVSNSMFTDHMPNKYEKGITSALENINKEEYTRKPLNHYIDPETNKEGKESIGDLLEKESFEKNQQSSPSQSTPEISLQKTGDIATSSGETPGTPYNLINIIPSSLGASVNRDEEKKDTHKDKQKNKKSHKSKEKAIEEKEEKTKK
ncbi:hypothetical protein DICPUDRAFT_151806 [Dictyostelium purpureum]|uniref:sn-1-specific diacylglycerol lipase n=1 Tax=Dictyostelium purpureum TaxID=5786 RepID=F0ZJS8_DICPU|nr:uncharacterized protein DICPUDRAFT_151806 [Dictyostelium purpureum]EGC35792.1 hypothetical protein DICPUDRAFT_151806 [Dictyostelium purpureum]|eukprot:XP_003287686.1 hypothetical protein DICPUDRAFT_151806 [Dictyostelium purpureum]